MTENQKAIIHEVIRTYCIAHNWYTHGTNADYENMFNLVGSDDNWPRLVACDVFRHSGNITWDDTIAMETYLNDLWKGLQDTEEPYPCTTITTEIVWHRASEELPSVSSEYLVLQHNGCYNTLPYSSKWKRFNTRDISSPAEAKDCAIKVDYWAELPKLPQIEHEDNG